ncbi:MAG: DUF6263 family protein [Bacteroidota bacterium]|nr:DUF6263 family protein [Bacteroidota bacterium]MDP4233764.1 DUF6263 family protein [Bacteroidota bacterium]MDP4242403.1 DUF6263 family protein [Bacteroidota bacterium]MDP4287525.1 DUF6263 family protein [Bacteroidota bacterium]
MNFRTTLLFAGLTILVACGKKDTAPTTTTTTTIDTTVKAEPVVIADTNHHLYFRPVAGSVRRYHVIDRMTAEATDAQPGGQTDKHAGTSQNEFYVTATTGTTGSDSSVELTVRVDSISLSADQDTTHTRYSSNNAKDRANERYRQFNIMIGKTIKVRVDKYGDLAAMTDVSAISGALMSQVPDSLRSNPRIQQMATQQAQEIANSYLMRVLVHSPTRALIKDTTWRHSSDVNLNIAQGLSFPVTVAASETVRGLERRNGRVLAVLEDNTTTTPKKLVLQEGPTKATISNFVATSHGVARVDDATGVLFHRALDEKRSFTFVVENTQHPGERRSISQNGSETLTVELIAETPVAKP